MHAELELKTEFFSFSLSFFDQLNKLQMRVFSEIAKSTCSEYFSKNTPPLLYFVYLQVIISFNVYVVVNCQIEQEERAKIDAIKEEERKKATEAIERWKENQKLHVTQEIETSKEDHLVMDDNKDSEPEFKDEKPDIKETKVDESDGETQMMTSYKPTVKVQPSHNNKRTTGMFSNILLRSRMCI